MPDEAEGLEMPIRAESAEQHGDVGARRELRQYLRLHGAERAGDDLGRLNRATVRAREQPVEAHFERAQPVRGATHLGLAVARERAVGVSPRGGHVLGDCVAKEIQNHGGSLLALQWKCEAKLAVDHAMILSAIARRRRLGP